MDKLKQLWDDKPMELLAVSAALGIAASKLIDSFSSVQSRRAYAKNFNRKSSKK